MNRLAPVLIALAVSLVLGGAVALVAVAAPSFFFGYEWPSIKGNAPEDGTSLLIVGAVTTVVYPPLRRWIAAELHHVHAKMDHNAHMVRLLVHAHPDIDNAVLEQHPQPARGRPSKGRT